MLKFIAAILCLGSLFTLADTRAADNLTLTKYGQSSLVPEAFLSLGGGSAMANRTYKDEDGKIRSDKIYYTMTHSYKSTYKMEDVANLLNPSSGKIGSLLHNTDVKRSSKVGIFEVLMEISTPIKDFLCSSVLSYKNSQEDKKNVFVYSFTNFNMVFTDMVIRVEVEEVKSELQVKVTQISALKGLTYDKLKTFFAVGKFEKSMKENIKKLKDGVGGI
jgi:hypothetical protein